MAVRPIDGDELLGITRLLDTDAVRQSKTASWLLDQVLHDIQAMPTLTPPNEWVSVEDRLPDTDGAYLVYAPTYTGGSSSSLDCIGGIMFSRFKHEKWSIESGYYKRPNCVTHWMPIPTPYDIDHIHISEPPEG